MREGGAQAREGFMDINRIPWISMGLHGYPWYNMEFHRTLYLRAQSPIMLSMLETVWLQLSPTIRFGLSENWNLLDKNEHDSILEALKKNHSENLSALIDKDISICENLFLLF